MASPLARLATDDIALNRQAASSAPPSSTSTAPSTSTSPGTNTGIKNARMRVLAEGGFKRPSSSLSMDYRTQAGSGSPFLGASQSLSGGGTGGSTPNYAATGGGGAGGGGLTNNMALLVRAAPSVVKTRSGSVLSRGFILKTDHYPSGTLPLLPNLFTNSLTILGRPSVGFRTGSTERTEF